MAKVADVIAADMRALNNLMNHMFIGVDPSTFNIKHQSFPCYNITQTNDLNNNPLSVRIDFALAGYAADQLEVIVENSKLFVGTKDKFKELNPLPSETNVTTKVLHQGITNRRFEITFPLAPQLSETPQVTFRDGILSVTFEYQNQVRKCIPIISS